MTKYIVAVSGGVDSVALLHMLHNLGQHELIVAHVDHGIRPDSDKDAAFVQRLAQQYSLPFETIRYELGSEASEDRARQARYRFLHDMAAKHEARLVTAHHADDVLETMAINIHRGTGWRGLATHSADVDRPLTGFTKTQLKKYALRHGLRWREDSTNQDSQYLRNRIREHVQHLPTEHKQKLLDLRHQQLVYKQAIESEVQALIGDGPDYSRYFFTHITNAAAIECLRHVTNAKLTRPQLERALLAIKTAQPGKTYEAGAGITLEFTSRNFSVALIK